MKKIVIVLWVVMVALSACSMPKLVKVEDAPDPTATAVVVVPEPTDEVVQPTKPAISAPDTSPQILLLEEFTIDDGTWNTGVWKENAGEDRIVDGQYLMTVIDDSRMIWSETFDVGTPDVILEVEASLYSGSVENSHGFVCRYVDEDNFYILTVGNDGWYSIDKFVDDNYENLASDFVSPDLIDPNSNLVRAECNGNKLILWSNDILLAEVEDSSLPEGQVGLYTRSWDEGNITIAYDNFIVYAADSFSIPQGGQFDDGILEGNVLFSDDFESGPGDWMVGNYNQADLEIIYGWLTYTMKEPKWLTWDVTRQVDASDVKMQAFFSNDAEQTENMQGFVCRYQDDDNFYRITFGNDGYLRVGKRLNGEWIYFVDEYDTSDAIDPYFNFAEASCYQNTLKLWIYGELIVEVSDPDKSFANGDVGFIVGTFDDPTVVVSMDDFVVTSLD